MHEVSVPDLDRLPDSALLTVPQVAAVCGMGISTVWRKLGKDGFPRAARIGPRCTRVQAGALKHWLRVKVAA